ncbi:MAG TPA: HD domain-containing protein [Acidimicrobiales bacterium]
MSPALDRWLHLARRFTGSLRPGGPAPGDERWVADQLDARELALWDRLSAPDRRHAVTVARATVAALGPETPRPVVAAALLHDVGKLDSHLRTPARVVATLSAMVVGRERVPGRMGSYLHHDEIGADMLAAAGSDPLVVTWAREHHLPPSRWTITPRVANALKAADDD